jgi:hypothetical protein
MRRFPTQNRNERSMKKKSFFSSTYQSGGERTGKSLRNKLPVAIVRSVDSCLPGSAIDVNPKSAEQSEPQTTTTWTN